MVVGLVWFGLVWFDLVRFGSVRLEQLVSDAGGDLAHSIPWLGPGRTIGHRRMRKGAQCEK